MTLRLCGQIRDHDKLFFLVFILIQILVCGAYVAFNQKMVLLVEGGRQLLLTFRYSLMFLSATSIIRVFGSKAFEKEPKEIKTSERQQFLRIFSIIVFMYAIYH